VQKIRTSPYTRELNLSNDNKPRTTNDLRRNEEDNTVICIQTECFQISLRELNATVWLTQNCSTEFTELAKYRATLRHVDVDSQITIRYDGSTLHLTFLTSAS